tara:strand:+ start:1157 stop:1789 length:633 start_codon:yes stop_codon:yes gene_type:complete
MSDILRQVDEELRQDRMLNLWKRYRLYLIGGVILIVCSVLIYQINKSASLSFNEELVEKYISSADLDDYDKSIEILSQIEGSDKSLIASIAKIKMANLLMEKDNIQDSRAKLLEVINDDNNEILLIDLAIYFYLMGNLKDLQQVEIEKYLTNDKIKTSSFKFLYRELIAIKNLLSGNNELSLKNFNDLINDVNTPRDIVIRASKFIESIN